VLSKALVPAVLLICLAATDARAQSTQLPASGPPVSNTSQPAILVESQITDVDYVIHKRSRATPKAQKVASSTATLSPLDGLSPAQLGVLEKLNRVDAARLGRLDAIVAPAEWTDEELIYSPFPQDYAWAADKPTAIVVDQTAQAFGAYEYGRLVRWGPVSTGSQGQTPAGLFSLSWRSRGHHSSVDPSWYLEWYFNFIPARGIAFHKYSLPGQAASHGCVRLLERDAQWLFEWGEAQARGNPGTAVVVLGCPDSSKPWRSADFLRSGIVLPAVPSATRVECSGYSGKVDPTQRRTIR
jgi:lipoprotein-anchoring transpeptidase ErfK/SrfK